MPTRRRRMPDKMDEVAPRRNRAARKPRNVTHLYKTGKLEPVDQDDFVLTRIIRGPTPNTLRHKDPYLHVSDLINRCMRMYALAERTNTTLTGDPLYTNMEVTFAIGNAIGQYLVDKSAQFRPDALLGRWSCACGYVESFGTKREVSKTECPRCQTKLHRYGEVQFISEEYNISGSADLTYLIRNHLYLAEIKSIKKEDWESLERPLPNHRMQILFYWWLARQAGYSLFKQVSVLYVCKAHTRGNPIKEFVFNPEMDLERLDPYLEDALMLKESKEGGELPYRVCASETATMARGCKVCTVCFGV